MIASWSEEKKCRVLDKSDQESDKAADTEVKKIMSKWKRSKSATEEPVAKKMKTSSISPAVKNRSKSFPRILMLSEYFGMVVLLKVDNEQG